MYNLVLLNMCYNISHGASPGSARDGRASSPVQAGRRLSVAFAAGPRPWR